MFKRANAAILLSITFLLATCGPAPSQAPEASAPVPGPVVPVGQPEVGPLAEAPPVGADVQNLWYESG